MSSLDDAIREKLNEAGVRSEVTGKQTIGGGSINEAMRLMTTNDSFFVKAHRNPPPDFFEAEAVGLKMLSEVGTLRIPEVVASGGVPGEKTRFLILEWIEPGRASGEATEALGRGLAAMHQQRHSQYGLGMDNYIGSLPQPNGWYDSWTEFYAEKRIRAQRDIAKERGYLNHQRAKGLERLIGQMDNFIDAGNVHPAPLHGDLWGGNWMASAEGDAVLIDPAAFYGDREIDIAMSRLFGGFPRRFYEAYNEVFPLMDGYEDRLALYQLYFLLVHLNLFGESYGRQVDGILRRYVG